MGALQSKTYQVEKKEKESGVEVRKKSTGTKKDDRLTLQLKEEVKKDILEAQKGKNNEVTVRKDSKDEPSAAKTDLIQAGKPIETKNSKASVSQDAPKPVFTPYAINIQEQSTVSELKPEIIENAVKETDQPPAYQENADKPVFDKVIILEDPINKNPKLSVSEEENKDNNLGKTKENSKEDGIEDKIEIALEDPINNNPELSANKEQIKNNDMLGKAQEDSKENKIEENIEIEKQQLLIEVKKEKIKVKEEDKLQSNKPLISEIKQEPETQEKTAVTNHQSNDNTESTCLKQDESNLKKEKVETKSEDKIIIEQSKDDLKNKDHEIVNKDAKEQEKIEIKTSLAEINEVEKKKPLEDENKSEIKVVKIEELQIEVTTKKDENQIHIVAGEQESIDDKENKATDNIKIAKKVQPQELTIAKATEEQESKKEEKPVEVKKKAEEKIDFDKITVDIDDKKEEKQVKFAPVQENNSEIQSSQLADKKEIKTEDETQQKQAIADTVEKVETKQATESKILGQDVIVHEVKQEECEKSVKTEEIKLEVPIAHEVSSEVKLSENHIPNHIQAIHPILKEIQAIEEKVKGLRDQIIHFTGTEKDAQYMTLNEMLIQNMIKLDDLSGETDEEVRSERKKVIKFVQDCLNTLERNVEKVKVDSDSE